ncbi:MAG TPA: cytochrome c [Bacteroidia bacterium]|jgi:cytochrome c6|nr:cytochrome c [Bacteroidia bacterium]
MKKLTILLPVFLLTFFSACGGDKEKSPADSTSTGTTVSVNTNGGTLYNDKCSTCHGADGKAGVMGAKDLSVSTLDHATAVALVKSGKGMMKSFGGELTDVQVEAVVKYAESLRK